MKVWLVAVLVGLVAFTSACAQSDGGITTSVKNQLAADDLVRARNIDVDTNNRVVTLTGSVHSEGEQTKAVEIARGTRGVVDVVNRLSIAPASEPQGAPTPGRLSETPGTTDRPNFDPGLTAEIKTRLLADPTVSGLKINVDTRDRVVTLTGSVSTQAEKERALGIARGVENVVRVEDRLTVGKQPGY
jgi:hyperosmotically inducible periplasmic protein